MIYEIYFSPTGGTEKVIHILGDAWGGERQTLDLSVQTCEGTEFSEEDICLIGVPVFGGRVPAPATERLRRMKADRAWAVPVAVYGARAYDDALLELKDILTEKGFRCGAAIAALAEHSIFREFGHGRPDQEDTAVLREYAGKIRAQYEEHTLPEAVTVPGNRPYVKVSGLPFHPAGNTNCIGCGKCAAACPTGAISGPDYAKTDRKKCISCMRCIAICPSRARGMNKLVMKAARSAIAKAFAGERHNELFIG